MRLLAAAIIGSWLAACSPASTPPGPSAAPTFDGAGAPAQADRIAHGARLADIFACDSCHLPDYTGGNFGAVVPLLDGLWSTNISRTMPEMTDAELETILREGRRSDRALYLMPSKQTHFLSGADMEALIAYLRTIEPTGERTPEPPDGFADAVAERLPDDYWRFEEYGRRFYPTSADEVAFYVEHRPPDLGAELSRGRYVATTVCSACHGAALDGYGEGSGDIQATLRYDEAAFDALLARDVAHESAMAANEWAGTHANYPLTANERADVYRYVRALAESRASETP